MKTHINRLLLLLLLFATAAGVYAREYGESRENLQYRYEVSEGKKLNVRSKPSPDGTLVGQLKAGDIVYFDSDGGIENGGYTWFPIRDKWNGRSATVGYVTNPQRFIAQDNPYFVGETAEEYDDYVDPQAREETQNVVKWILFILSIIMAGAGLFFYFMEDANEKIFGTYDEGMRRTFFFNFAPYRTVVYISAILLAAAIASIILLLAVGGIGFVLMWIIKILCYALLWIGIIGCVLGVIACFCGAFVGLIPAIIGGIIWAYEDSLTTFADNCADAGLAFFHRLNVIDFSMQLVENYWGEALLVAATPIAVFLLLALIWLLVAGAFMLFEHIVTARYNINHPCPHCQQPSEPAVYLSCGSEGYMPLPNDIRLRPGMYGLFHITHPDTGERMPTMIMNGRDTLVRRCANCEHLIQANEGTECHMAMVGSAKAGKSTLTYRMIAEIFRTAGDDRVEFTDVKNSIKDRHLTGKVANIARNGRIDEADMPAKTSTDDLASTQLIIHRKNMPVPYRLFINDVGGEVFDPNSSANTGYAARFFHNVNSVLLLLDPFTTDFSDCDTSAAFRKWLEKHADEISGQLLESDLRTAIDNNLSKHGNDKSKVHLNIILPKCDTGYIPSGVDLDSQEELKSYIADELGLG
ncbi:MAG: hypothetical protein K2L80_04870, partial [Muribaculaceae bacterium]|nr:hypothetical protein [Muribaculaceae bacterium]